MPFKLPLATTTQHRSVCSRNTIAEKSNVVFLLVFSFDKKRSIYDVTRTSCRGQVWTWSFSELEPVVSYHFFEFFPTNLYSLLLKFEFVRSKKTTTTSSSDWLTHKQQQIASLPVKMRQFNNKR